jgi:hypothetical protein
MNGVHGGWPHHKVKEARKLPDGWRTSKTLQKFRQAHCLSVSNFLPLERLSEEDSED